MTPREIRRAAERQAAKQPRLTPAASPSISPEKLTANRANAQLSCGPTSDAGKLVSSLNALKTALTGRTVLLPTDDVAAYEALLAATIGNYNPATIEERELLQSITDTTWRLKRILNLEFGIFTKGSLEFADEFPDLEPAARAQMILVETFLKYEKSIRNLNTQEARLQRRLAKDTTELKRLQAERRQNETEEPGIQAAKPSQKAAQLEVGFEFSNDEIALYHIAAAQESLSGATPSMRL